MTRRCEVEKLITLAEEIRDSPWADRLVHVLAMNDTIIRDPSLSDEEEVLDLIVNGGWVREAALRHLLAELTEAPVSVMYIHEDDTWFAACADPRKKFGDEELESDVHGTELEALKDLIDEVWRSIPREDRP